LDDKITMPVDMHGKYQNSSLRPVDRLFLTELTMEDAQYANT